MIMSLISGGGGIILGSWKAMKAEKARRGEADAQRLHIERLASAGQLAEYQEQIGKINIQEIILDAKFIIIFMGKEFGWHRKKNTKAPVASPTQRTIHGVIWLFSFTYCITLGIFAYNAQRVIWQFAPTDAKDHWSVLFGFAEHTVENPQIVAVTLGGVALGMAQPLIAIIGTYITGLAYRLIRG